MAAELECRETLADGAVGLASACGPGWASALMAGGASAWAAGPGFDSPAGFWGWLPAAPEEGAPA